MRCCCGEWGGPVPKSEGFAKRKSGFSGARCSQLPRAVRGEKVYLLVYGCWDGWWLTQCYGCD